MPSAPGRPGRPPALAAVAGLCVVVVLVAGIAVVARDFVMGQRFDPGMLCQRDDGSVWRSASGCDAGNDPRCEPGECRSSQFVAERAREADTWLLFRYGVPASGDPPHFSGAHPGSGRYVVD